MGLGVGGYGSMGLGFRVPVGWLRERSMSGFCGDIYICRIYIGIIWEYLAICREYTGMICGGSIGIERDFRGMTQE